MTIFKIFAAALFLRLLLPALVYAWTGDASAFLAPDSRSYLDAANALVRSGSFLSSSGAPEIVRTPGYPLFLTLGVLSGCPVAVTLVLQALLGAATVCLVYMIAAQLKGDAKTPGPETAGAGLYALEPLSLVYTSFATTETLFTFILVLSTWPMLNFIRTGNVTALVWAALGFGLLAYVRPAAYYLPFAAGGFLLALPAAGRRTRTRSAASAIVFLILIAAVIAPWHWRNIRSADYRGFSAITDVNLFFYQGAAVEAAVAKESYYAVQDRLGYRDPERYYQDHPEQRTWTEARIYEFMRAEGLAMIRSHPWTYAVIHLKGILRTLLDPGASEWLKLFRQYPQRGGGLLGTVIDRGILNGVHDLWEKNPMYVIAYTAGGLLLLAYYSLFVLSFRRAGRETPAGVCFILLVMLYFLIISGGPNAVGRFRHPVMPFICVLAGKALFLASKTPVL